MLRARPRWRGSAGSRRGETTGQGDWMLRGSSEISRGCAIKRRLAAREEWRPEI
jgi:hypothetical protein